MRRKSFRSCILTGLLTMITWASLYGQNTTKSGALEQFVAKYTLMVPFNNLSGDIVSSFSYLVVYDRKSKLDTIIMSPISDSVTLTKDDINELKQKYENLPSQGFNLTNTAIFVPVLVMPSGKLYSVLLNDESLLQARKNWVQLFSTLNSDLVKNRCINYVVPVTVTTSAIK